MREHRDTIYVCTFVRHLLSGDISCILEQWGSTVARLRTKSAARYVGRLVRKKRKKKKKKGGRKKLPTSIPKKYFAIFSNATLVLFSRGSVYWRFDVLESSNVLW